MIYSNMDHISEGLVQSELDGLRDDLGDSFSHNVVDFLLNSLGWVGGNFDGVTVEKFGLEAEVVTASLLASVSTSEEGFVSALRVFLVFVSSEAK